MATKAAPPLPTLGSWIKENRERLGLSQAKLARAVDVDEKNIRNWESGRHEPSARYLIRLHVLFDRPLPYGATAGYVGQPEWPMADEPDALAVVG